ALHPNYPNPFNPETWIPFQLAQDTVVKLEIFSFDGKLLRTLDLGQLSAGLYLSQDRAAYWDGRNGNGEDVASGVYFGVLSVGDNQTYVQRFVMSK
ncbi:TPA: T9SS type A sorting domain-containing protein, partial [Candidatus Poribacteria bacterium]|nr:T9SS type A sorting domain-containing protein [Candidatus Poribacteria bacterium]